MLLAGKIHVPLYVFEGQRLTLCNQFPPSTSMWPPGIELSTQDKQMHPYPLTHPIQSVQRLHDPLCRKGSTTRIVFLVSSLTQADNMITGELCYSHKKGDNAEVSLSEHVTWEVRSCWCCWGAVPSLTTGFNMPSKEWGRGCYGWAVVWQCFFMLQHAILTILKEGGVIISIVQIQLPEL